MSKLEFAKIACTIVSDTLTSDMVDDLWSSLPLRTWLVEESKMKNNSHHHHKKKAKKKRKVGFSRVSSLRSLAKMAVVMDHGEKNVEQHKVTKALLDTAVLEKQTAAHVRLSGRIAKRKSMRATIKREKGHIAPAKKPKESTPESFMGSVGSVGSVGSRRTPHRSSTRSARSARSARRRGGADVDEIDTIENIEDSQREDTLRLRRIGLSQLLDAIKSQRTLFGKRIKGGCMFFVEGGALWVYCVLPVVSQVFVFFLCVLGEQVPSKLFWRSTEIKKE